ncbi:hypothetical protein FRB96_001091 [Tulasnella sp. 330]|nr:hypothetical protein FRB96_001091 [Tulasnella sp. 330]
MAASSDKEDRLNEIPPQVTHSTVANSKILRFDNDPSTVPTLHKTMASQNLCPWCGIKAPFPGFKHCGKTCATAAAAAAAPPSGFAQYNVPDGIGRGIAPPLATPWQNQAMGANPFPTNSGSPQCALPGCRKPPYDWRAMYCSNVHRAEAVTQGHAVACILCKRYPKMQGFYCGQACQDDSLALAPMILRLEEDDPKFNDIRHQFDVSWRHTNKRKPEVRYVYKIIQTEDIADRYERYRDDVEDQGNFLSQRKSQGNECRRWHGTKRVCSLGDDPDDLELCQSPKCALCCIITTNFRKELVGASGRSFNRFGLGIYASATSSKSDDYTSKNPSSSLKAMLLTHVVVGKGLKLTRDNTRLTSPPAGYDSVLGETGDSLNYDEVVVYENYAIVPAWLVVYGP